MNLIKKNNLGYIYIFISAILFSLGGVLIKMISWSPITINGVRNILAFLVMFVYLKKIHHKLVINRVVILGAVCNLFMNLTFVMATKLTSAANAIVLQFTEPIFLILFLYLIWKHKPDKKAVVTCVFVFGGILCFFFEKITLHGLVGNILAIISGILYAFVFLIKKMKHSDFESSILISQFISFAIGLPWYVNETNHSYMNYILVIILGVVQMGLAYLFLAKGLSRVSPVAASLASTIEPILNPIWVAIFYHEMISPLAIVGAIIVIFASTGYSVINTRTSREQLE